jgi:hypothetical protein
MISGRVTQRAELPSRPKTLPSGFLQSGQVSSDHTDSTANPLCRYQISLTIRGSYEMLKSCRNSFNSFDIYERRGSCQLEVVPLSRWEVFTSILHRRTTTMLCGVGGGVAPPPQPQTGRASFQASGFPDVSRLGNASARSHSLLWITSTFIGNPSD